MVMSQLTSFLSHRTINGMALLKETKYSKYVDIFIFSCGFNFMPS